MSNKVIQPCDPMQSCTFPRAKPDFRPFESQKLSKNAQSKMILAHRCAHVHSKEPQVPLCSWPSPVIKTGGESSLVLVSTRNRYLQKGLVYVGDPVGAQFKHTSRWSILT